MPVHSLSQGLSERLNGVEWNGDSSRETEMEVCGWECVQGYSVGRKLCNDCGFEVITELGEAGGKVLRQLNWRKQQLSFQRPTQWNVYFLDTCTQWSV